MPNDGSRATSVPPPLGWLRALETGIAEIDADHRALIRQCDVLTGMLAEHASWDALHAAACDLAELCREHFEREEAMLVRSAFPRSEAHIREHRWFRAQFGQLANGIHTAQEHRYEQLKIVDRLRDLLVDLLVRHDLDYKSHLLHWAGR